ncbi:response regulator [Oscillatoriales cyanobacterium LEGE 11467]|uniref:Response regulator n=1 Tax=Zarconia navalis LEGE 11467 TaxID=1828826 RepID=A0A928VU66_9CYAN|nr:response regulator [Zarconia navalis]MBE9039494.1 response regulator [Zarconia navalis LEGE 11467]
MANKQLLVVDDDDGVRRIIEMCLQSTTNWNVLTAASGEEALRLAQNEQPDAILLDVMMPDFNGIETLDRLRTQTSTQDIPVIFLTAKVLEKEKQKLMKLSIQGLISKPFDVLDLNKEIRCLLNW